VLVDIDTPGDLTAARALQAQRPAQPGRPEGAEKKAAA
jgi:hypothetical protein